MKSSLYSKKYFSASAFLFITFSLNFLNSFSHKISLISL